MKKSCAIAAVACTALITSILPVSAATDDAASQVLSNIAGRASVRSYSEKPVALENVEKLLRAAMAAPSAVNRQPWQFIVVTEKSILGKLGEAFPNARYAAKAPLAIIVCGDLSRALKGGGRDFWVQDVSAATENLLLAAHFLGLGAVWCGIYPDPERTKKLAAFFQLPETVVPFNIVVIGHPDGAISGKDKWDASKVHTNRW